MPVDRVGGNLDAMNSHATVLATHHEEFKTTAAKIRSSVEAMTSEFYGQGSIEYQNQMAKLNGGLNQCFEVLDGLKMGVSKSAGALGDLDSQIARGFGGFGG
ncbi:MAG TPA: WXG100 family type VII secretion target [Ktedonobacteraceae bacterium]|jgi:WXG100 family type VII secretion target|nr:WXG100 family type VII secretion target [Ktedonobacteraceae bacterium]